MPAALQVLLPTQAAGVEAHRTPKGVEATFDHRRLPDPSIHGDLGWHQSTPELGQAGTAARITFESATMIRRPLLFVTNASV